jgi:hypothetical protein
MHQLGVPMLKMSVILLGSILLTAGICNAQVQGKHFDRAIFVLFENTDYRDALNQQFFAELAGKGASFSNFTAETHPSQANYISLTSGDENGVRGDGSVDLDVKNVVDLLEAKGLTWKVYAEDYPGNCFKGATSGDYARKHNPFISYLDIQKTPARCANIVSADQFDIDAQAGKLPNYVFFIPNNQSDGHDTGVSYADRWYQQKFGNYVADPKFMAGTILITTFDEGVQSNQVYTSIVGPKVRNLLESDKLSHYSLLRLIEENWDLGTLGKKDSTAVPVPNIWTIF